ncbi:MAG TPA: GMC family oxidoreductase [Thermomicrobiales bacterium]|nr:GMC family oxidoreductase [Thermomicrobiales bacterium]
MVVHKKVDVVTIGAGWTSGILGWKLGAAGYSVVALESGPVRYANPNFSHNHDTLKHEIHTALMYDISRETWTWRPNPKAPSLPIRQFGSFHPGRGLGGASVHWTAQLWRFMQADFKHRSHNIERYGKDKIPEDMTIQDWPIDYADLEPFYDAVDYDIGASGQAGNLNGDLIKGGNIFEEPRSRPYPNPAHPVSVGAEMFKEATERLGYHPFPQPAGILSQAYESPLGDKRAACIYCGFCTRYGCEVDAKASGANTHIPAALRTGNYAVRANCKVTGINVGTDGLATGVNYVDLETGDVHEQPADVVICSAYTLSNVRMLLLSRSERHPDGIGNDRGRVGKNYTYQITKTPVTGLFKGHRFNQFMGNGVIQSLIYDFNADVFDHSDLDFIGGASISAGSGQRDPLTSVTSLATLGADKQQGDIENTTKLPATTGEVGSVSGKGNQWGKDWKENLRNNWDSMLGIGIQGEWQAYEDQFLDLDPTYTDALGQPLLRFTVDFHDNEYNMYRFLAKKCQEIAQEMGADDIDLTDEMDPYDIHTYQSTHCTGGAIMGSSPEDSVTNSYGQVWDTPNVFVTGAALYPQNPGANPTGTLLALAYRTGDAMVDRYFKDPNQLLG